jgi:hypothetical protein
MSSSLDFYPNRNYLKQLCMQYACMDGAGHSTRRESNKEYECYIREI